MNWTHALGKKRRRKKRGLTFCPCYCVVKKYPVTVYEYTADITLASSIQNTVILKKIPAISCKNKTKSYKIIINNFTVKFFPVVSGTLAPQKMPSFHCYIIYKLQLEEFANYDLLAGSICWNLLPIKP